MTSRGTERFWQLYIGLPPDIKTAARRAFAHFRENQTHPGLRLERMRSRSSCLVGSRDPQLSRRRVASWRRLALGLDWRPQGF